MLGKGGSGSGLRSGGIFCFGPATNFPFSNDTGGVWRRENSMEGVTLGLEKPGKDGS